MGPGERTVCREIPSEDPHIPVFVLLNASKCQGLLVIRSGLEGSGHSYEQGKYYQAPGHCAVPLLISALQ